jgi:hypothetical protein
MRVVFSQQLLLESQSETTGKNASETDIDAMFSGFISAHKNGLPLAVAVAHKSDGTGGGDKENTGDSSIVSWSPLYINTSMQTNQRDSSVDRTPDNTNLVRLIRDNFSNNNDRDDAIGESDWPLNEWDQIQQCLSSNNPQPSKCNVYSGESKIDQRKVVSHCHVAPITSSIKLVVVQGVGSQRTKKRQISDDDIAVFMNTVVSNLSPDNVFSIGSLLTAKQKMRSETKATQPDPKVQSTTENHVPNSLWSESAWSDSQRKKILNTLGLRMNSPVIAPLKSPYVKRQIRGMGRRKKKMKSSINHGHLELFLGPELSQLL